MGQRGRGGVGVVQKMK